MASIVPQHIIYTALKSDIDTDSDSFTAVLLGNYVPDKDDYQWTDISANEIANGNGYTNFAGGGLDITANVSWTKDDANDRCVFDVTANIEWTAAGGSISAYYAAIIDDTHANNLIVAVLDLGGQQTATDGNNFTIVPNATGIFVVNS